MDLDLCESHRGFIRSGIGHSVHSVAGSIARASAAACFYGHQLYVLGRTNVNFPRTYQTFSVINLLFSETISLSSCLNSQVCFTNTIIMQLLFNFYNKYNYIEANFSYFTYDI